jgi:hypothetical protein
MLHSVIREGVRLNRSVELTGANVWIRAPTDKTVANCRTDAEATVIFRVNRAGAPDVVGTERIVKARLSA